MVPLSQRLRRALHRLVRWGQGEVHPTPNLHHAEEVLRFAAVFAATIVLPALFLAWLALASLRTSELQFDADLRTRAEGMTEQIHVELSAIFNRFEEATASRMSRGESPIQNVGELSPYLRGAFHFDPSGKLAAPFIFEESQPRSFAHPAWRESMANGRRAEAEDPRAAAQHYRAAAQSIREPVFVAEAMLAEARARHAANDHRAADQILEELRGQDWAETRLTRGFQVGDLATLARAERLLTLDPAKGTDALRELVGHLLTYPWVMGQRGDAAVIRRALELLEGHVEADWLARMGARLNSRVQQHDWVMRVQEELELLNVRNHEPGFRYYGARLDSDALWATIRTTEGLYAFSFSAEDLYTELTATAERTSLVDPDLDVRLVLSNRDLPEDVLSWRPLDPYMAVVRAAAYPSDASDLSRRMSAQRQLRGAVIAVALFLVVVGVGFSLRIVGREMENARIKTDFAANVSHELRSPITQIRLKGEALQLDLVEPGQDMRDHFDAIVRESERLSRLVDNVLDFAAIERGAKRYQLRPDDLLGVVELTVEANRNAVESMGLKLHIDVPDDLPPIWMDREALGQVLVNLLSNAAKYGAEGGEVGVRVRLIDEGVRLSVSDRGVGIAPLDLPHVFEHFYRSTDPNIRRRKGTGIGLTIVRYIVEAHGGSISVDSTPRKGTTFTIDLPLEPPEGAGERA